MRLSLPPWNRRGHDGLPISRSQKSCIERAPFYRAGLILNWLPLTSILLPAVSALVPLTSLVIRVKQAVLPSDSISEGHNIRPSRGFGCRLAPNLLFIIDLGALGFGVAAPR
jgi:hypothetical protein